MKYRHGDVITLPLKTSITGTPVKGCTLALGEATGHSHRIEEGASRILFDGRNKSHVDGRLEAFKLIKDEFKREFSDEEFPFTLDDFTVECFVIVEQAPVTLKHEEHKTLVYDTPGTHAVVIQRDYTPEGWKRVVD